MKKKEYEEYSGIVVAIDFLGVKGLASKKERISWLNKRDKIVEKIMTTDRLEEKKILENAKQYFNETFNKELPEGVIKLPDRKIQTFQDNIVVSFVPPNKIDEVPDHIFIIRQLLMEVFVFSLESGQMIRGAVSAGGFIHDVESTTIIGPAVNEVMCFCEIADWAGIIFCPSFNEIIETLFKNNMVKEIKADEATKRYDAIRSSFVKYQFPVSGKNKKIMEIKEMKIPQDLYCLGWPYDFYNDVFVKEGQKYKKGRKLLKNKSMYVGKTLKRIKEILEKIPRDKKKSDVEKKYEHTFSFAEHCLRRKNQSKIRLGVDSL